MKAASFIPGFRKVKLPHRLPPVFKGIFVFIFLVLFSGLSHGSTVPDFQFLSPLTEKLNLPTSIAFDNQGDIYVADARDNRILIFNRQGQQIDLIKGLGDPISIAVDDEGKVYVGNERDGSVKVFDANHTLSHTLGSDTDEFVQPNDIAVDNVTGDVYVADYKKSVVGIYNAGGQFIKNLGKPGSGNGQFYSPLSVAIDTTAAEIIVLDRGMIRVGSRMMGSWVPGARVQFFSMDGTFLRSFNKLGNATGDLVRPQRLEVDQESRLYITDSYFNAVLMYDNVGGYLGAIFDNDNSLRSPLGVSLDFHNKLYVASALKKRVEVYGIDAFISMNAAPSHLSFSMKEGSGESETQPITLLNNGNKLFTWTAVTDAGWLTLSDQQGELDIGEEGIFDAHVDISGLAPGSYSGSISVSVGTVDMAVIDVSLTVQPSSVLSVTPPTLQFTAEVGSLPLPQVVTITNGGSLPLHWDLSVDQSWIVTKEFTGTVAAASSAHMIAVYPDTRIFGVGTYTGTITIAGVGAVGSPVSINVVVTMTERSDSPIKGKNKDSDHDGISDYQESCPQDPNKFEPGVCGCGVADEDTNNNNVIDCLEQKKGKLMFPIKTKDGTIIIISL